MAGEKRAYDLTDAEWRLIRLCRIIGRGRIEFRHGEASACEGVDITIENGQPLRAVRILKFDKFGGHGGEDAA